MYQLTLTEEETERVRRYCSELLGRGWMPSWLFNVTGHRPNYTASGDRVRLTFADAEEAVMFKLTYLGE